ncbi:conserved exported hypothetical protein [Candidatus Zixiibacteriota bacterium]|nr:conserved exported hypothetical protein [candidate division Zixibacteria bacterium]
MIKIKLFVVLIVLLLTVPLAAAPPSGWTNFLPDKPLKPAIIDNTTFIDANNIFMFVTNHGNYGRDLSGYFGYDYGTWFPYTSIPDIIAGRDPSPYYAGGLWIGAIDSATGQTRVTIAEYSDEYVPGPMSGGTFEVDRPEFKVYKLYAESLMTNPNQTYLDYMQYAVPLGAPIPWVIDTLVDTLVSPPDTTIDTIPYILGDQMCWAVFNDANPSQHSNNSGSTLPLGVEVRQTTFSFNREDALGNVIFFRFQVFNKGNNVLRNLYFSAWNDPDLGGAGDDFVGCDTNLSIGFVYNSNNNDQYYGSTPPSLGIDFFQGPLLFTGNDADTAKMWNTKWPGYKNMGMTSFNKYINGTDPRDNFESYNYMRGLTKEGNIYIDTSTGLPTTFQLSGDPVAGKGDLDVSPADRRMMLSTGPITFRPGDSTEILTAMVIGRGGDRLSSVSVMKYFDRFAQSAYDVDFKLAKPPASPIVTAAPLNKTIVLSWTDTSEVVPGDYQFQGYTVYQGESGNGPWHRIANFDVVDGVALILDEVLDPLTGALESRGVKFGTDNGISYNFVVQQDYINGGELNNLTEYFFRVEAYSYDPAQTPKTLTAANRDQIVVEPWDQPAGTHLQANATDTLPVTHATGLSDGIVNVEVLDPTVFNGHTYRLTFQDTTVMDRYGNTVNTVWNLYDVTDAKWVLRYQTNQTGNNDYYVTDGFLVRVTGPSTAGIKPDDLYTTDDSTKWGWKIPAGTRRWTWANGAGFEFEGFEGALGWVALDEVFASTTGKVGVTETKNVLLKLATVDSVGNFSTDDPNVSYGYRYGRGFTAPPAQPSFAAHMINTTGSGYAFQDFAKTIPLSAWDIDVNPPQRLTLGYLENNAEHGLVDGIYFPAPSDTLAAYDLDNTDAAAPREFLFIFPNAYSETPDPEFQGDLLNSPNTPTMYWGTFNRRVSAVPYSPDSSGEDQFLIIPSKINSPLDTFTFVVPAPTHTANNVDLDKITAVPNPFYLFSGYDPNPGSNLLKFHHMPTKCTITIYNLAGDLIRTIRKDDQTPIATWDLLTEQGLPVASGIYIYVVDAPGFGQKIGKVAIFVESEVLKIY